MTVGASFVLNPVVLSRPASSGASRAMCPDTFQAVVILQDHDGRLPRHIGVRPPVTTHALYLRDLFVVPVDQGGWSVCERVVFKEVDEREAGQRGQFLDVGR
jgi:hypothetical protein